MANGLLFIYKQDVCLLKCQEHSIPPGHSQFPCYFSRRQTLLQTKGWSLCGSSKETVFFGYRIHCWATQFPQLKTFEKWQTRICSHLRHKVPSKCLYPGPQCRAVRLTGTLRGRQAFLASGTPGMNRRCSGTSYLAACISLRYLTMQKTTQSHVEIDDLDKLHSNISLRKIPKPSKPQLKNIQSSKFSTRTLHFFAVKKGGGCLGPLTYLSAQHVPCWEPCVHKLP